MTFTLRITRSNACTIHENHAFYPSSETLAPESGLTTSQSQDHTTSIPRPRALPNCGLLLAAQQCVCSARYSDLRVQARLPLHTFLKAAKMSVAVYRGLAAVPAFEAPCWLRPAEPYKQPEAVVDDRPAQVDIWNAIQADVDRASKKASKPYVHRSRSLMSQKSLEVCTESLGNETGSGDFTSSLDMAFLFDSPLPAGAAAEEESFWQHDGSRRCEEEQWESEDLAAVNYHCSAGTRPLHRRSFPPPLPSMSRRDGPCLQMRPRRQDGRLVVEAVAVRPRGYLHAKRQGGRLRLSFVECSARAQSAASKISAAAAEAPGTVVEVKVSTQPQAPTAGKVHRSTLVINKFVGSTPLSVDQPRCDTGARQPEANTRDDETTAAAQPSRPTMRRVPSSTTTLAAAVAAASTGTDVPPAPEDDDECGGLHLPAPAAAETKQLLLLSFTSRRGDKQDLLQSVRRCRQLRQKKLFILEPYCIATS
ncbi:Protein FAF-like, chloroplastic [Zea mays]|uniref:Protein FAF-like, chloroplastic n=1 Tax=Zea mays TaxID=4577 RepID=A0A3L6EMJ5_MAIZE|nr:Protein FAF-like, chloroplastic [Zea mays]